MVAAFVAAALVIGIALVVRRGGDDAPPTPPVDAVLEEADAIATPLVGELPDLSVVYSERRDDAAVVGIEVPALDAGDVYALWWGAGDDATVDEDTVGEDAVLIVTFQPDGSGTVEVLVEDFTALAEDAGVDPAAASYAVTVEPDGDVSSPTGPVVARSE